MRDFSQDHRWLSINTATVRKQRGEDWPLLDILDACAARGIRAVSPWRDQVAAAGLQATAQRLKSHGLELSGYCRGGMFTYTDAAGRQAVRDDNRRALDEACTLNAPCLVLVVGGLPGALAGKAAHRDIAGARAQVTRRHRRAAGGCARARACRWPSSRCTRCTRPTAPASTRWSRRWTSAMRSTPARSGALGVAVDLYHVWWDPKLHAQIERAGKRTAARLPRLRLADADHRTCSNDRGMMGDGVIDIRTIRAAVEAQGFAGYSEVEIFSSTNWWRRDGDEVLDTCIERHRRCV